MAHYYIEDRTVESEREINNIALTPNLFSVESPVLINHADDYKAMQYHASMLQFQNIQRRRVDYNIYIYIYYYIYINYIYIYNYI